MFNMKRSETISTLHAQYVSTFRPDPECGYSVRCAAFPELISHGDTLDDARTMAREALELCLEAYRDEGRPIPASDSLPRTTIKEVMPVKLAVYEAAATGDAARYARRARSRRF
jgi:antitoxin HicB